jgi:UDP-3-O-[3-hydroxymyristoyl] glucosamine N-acyltransferase
MSFRRRVTIINGLGLARARFAVACHPTAVVSPHAMIGVNVLIMAGVVVSATAVIEDHVVVLPNAVIHHHARIGAYSMIGSSVVVAGHVSIGECCYIGSGACLRNNIAVAPHTLLGLGATVVRAIDESGGVWAGTPARRLAPPGSSETLGSSASPRTIPPLRDASRSRE